MYMYMYMYHPPENLRSQNKMFLKLISLCKCDFSSFHNYIFFMQVQVGVLPEIILKQVAMQVPFLSIPGFWGTQLGLRHCREDSVGIFALENQSHWVGAIWVVPLEVLRTEMIRLQFCWSA